MKIKLASAKEYVRAHKTAIAVTATATTALVLHTIVIKKHNDFLKEHDLFDTYYPLEEN
jgi:hypothetical protein